MMEMDWCIRTCQMRRGTTHNRLISLKLNARALLLGLLLALLLGLLLALLLGLLGAPPGLDSW